MSQTNLLKEELIESFNCLIAKQTGIVIREQDRASFCEKICLRTKAIKAASPGDYYQLLESNTIESYQEWEKLIVLLTNNESYFYRDKEQLNLLKTQIFPELIKRKQAQKTIRICSAGCSTGQEPYTLAILLKEILPDFQQWNLLILGIDIDRGAIEEAARGIYEPWSFRGVDEEIKRRYFQKINNQYHLSTEIKKLVKFQTVNLVQDLFPQSQSELREMDLILCRNVFIYFESSAITKVLDKICHTLQPSGYFLTGHTELSAQNLSQFDKIVFPESIVYQRPGNKKLKLENEQNLVDKKKLSITPQPLVTKDRLTAQVNPVKTLKQYLTANNLNVNNSSYTKSKEIPLQKTTEEFLIEVETLLNQEKYEPAIELIKQILKINPNYFYAYYLLSQIHANLGQYEQAIQSCQQALKIDSFAVSPYYLLAKIAEEQGNIEEAKRILKQIIYLEPNSVGAYLDLSHIYNQEGDRQRANKMRESALNILKELPPQTKIKERGNITAAELLVGLERTEL
jgi:chemotaxis protein methyltransferase CheR